MNKEATEQLDLTVERDDDLCEQIRFQKTWNEMNPDCDSFVYKTVEECISHIHSFQQEEEGDDVLVTGSLHLVGSVLKYLKADLFGN